MKICDNQDIWDVLKILASILHMGNIKYKADDSTEAANIPEQSNVDRAAFFLGVNKVDFVRLVMINCSPFSGYFAIVPI